MLNQKFGRLLVVSDCQRIKANRPRYVCQCDCGNFVQVDHYHLKDGHTTSCGCAKLDRLVAMNKTHGQSKSPTYKAWCEARGRCRNVKHKHFRHYGGRGILFSEKWDRFEDFLRDLGERPSQRHSLDRIDVNGNYEPGNCRWATAAEQQNNKRCNRFFEYAGQLLTVTQLSRLTGIPQSNLHRWLVKQGRPIENVLAAS